jgi:hypothetical protein
MAIEAALIAYHDHSTVYQTSTALDAEGSPFGVVELGLGYTGERYYLWSDGDVSNEGRIFSNVSRTPVEA